MSHVGKAVFEMQRDATRDVKSAGRICGSLVVEVLGVPYED